MILLDTHVLVRYMQDDKLGRRTTGAIGRALLNGDAYVSAISFWELAMLVAKRRLDLGGTLALFRGDALHEGVLELPVDGLVGIAAGELPLAHGDPADRLIVAAAIAHDLTLFTADETLLGWRLRGFRTQDASD